MNIEVLSIGDLQDRIEIKQNAACAPDAGGEVVQVLSTYKKIWAKVNMLTGSEFPADKRTLSQTQVSFIIRYRRDIKRGMGVRWNGDEYEINSVLHSTDRRLTELLTSSRV